MDTVAAARKAQYLEDLAPGQRFGSGRLRVSAGDIRDFAARFDPQPFHLDEAAAQASLFKGLAASGWHTAALTMRLLVESEILEVRPSRSRPTQGLVKVRTTTFNQRDEPVQVFTGNLIVLRRAP